MSTPVNFRPSTMAAYREPEGLTVRVRALDHAAGSVVLFRGTVDDGRSCLFAAGHREAQDLVTALEAGGPVYASVEPWQLLG
jgi:hypothetical protein